MSGGENGASPQSCDSLQLGEGSMKRKKYKEQSCSEALFHPHSLLWGKKGKGSEMSCLKWDKKHHTTCLCSKRCIEKLKNIYIVVHVGSEHQLSVGS